MGIRDVCVPGGGTPPLRYPRKVVWIRRGVVRGWAVFALLRSDTSSVKNQRFLTASPQGGSEPSAASGRRSEVSDCRRSGVQASNRPAGAALSESQWQRSKISRKSVSPKIFSGTATGEPWVRRKAAGAEVDGEVTIPQSFPLYKQRKIQLPLHKGALGALEDGGAVEGREPFGTGNPSPTRGRGIGRICRDQWGFVMFVCREAERLPYEKTGGWVDSPWGGAGTQGFAAHLISQKSKIFDSFPSRGSLGCGGRREAGRVCRGVGRYWARNAGIWLLFDLYAAANWREMSKNGCFRLMCALQ